MGGRGKGRYTVNQHSRLRRALRLLLVALVGIMPTAGLLAGCGKDASPTNPQISTAPSESFEARMDEIVIPSLDVMTEISRRVDAEHPGADLREWQEAMWAELQDLKSDVAAGKTAMIGPLTNAEFFLLLAAGKYYTAMTGWASWRAQSEANTQWPGNQGNTKADAFRHAFWNELMSKYLSVGWAQAYATAHESETADGNAKRMDLNNNAVGRGIYMSNSSKSEAQLVTITKNFSYGYRNPINASYPFLVYFAY